MKNQASPSAVKSRRRNVSDSPQTSRRRSSRLSADELLLNIPIDLVMEIFSRLPLKSIARCRCVSKRWASILRSPEFTELFLTKSLTRPKLLFARKELFARKQEESEVIFFSSPQPQNVNERVSVIATDHHSSFPVQSVDRISTPVNGFVCITDERILKGRAEVAYVICNPSTRQCFTLPKTNKTRKRTTSVRSFLGYDPIEKQHKVLAMIKQEDGAVVHQVLTLRGNNGNMTWRMTECGGIHPSFPAPNNICINGVLYYIAKASDGDDDMIVCFDVKSEKFSSVKPMERGLLYAPLINFQGKLASVKTQLNPIYLEMWILEDPEKHEWSKRIFNLPPTWKDIVAAGEALYFVGATDTNEFVFAPFVPSDPFRVYYYNFVKETATRVEIQGMEAFEEDSINVTFMNHVEDVKLM